jgi:hypothetical protein
LSSGVALQAAFCINLLNCVIASSTSSTVFSGKFSRKFASIWFLNASRLVWLLYSFGGCWRYNACTDGGDYWCVIWWCP